MARIAFHYIPGNTFLHRWDARCKFLAFLFIMATLIQIKLSFFFFYSVLLIFLFFFSRPPLKSLARELKFWGIFLSILFLFHSFLTPGVPLSAVSYLSIKKEGLLLGGFVCWRLGLMLGYAILFTSVTRPRELRDTIAWFLKPIPFLPDRRIGLMVSMTWRFFYRFLDYKEEVILAHEARLGGFNRNPFKKVKSLLLPILKKALMEVEEVSLALAVRGYHDQLPISLPHIPFYQWIPVFALVVILFLLFL